MPRSVIVASHHVILLACYDYFFFITFIKCLLFYFHQCAVLKAYADTQQTACEYNYCLSELVMNAPKRYRRVSSCNLACALLLLFFITFINVFYFIFSSNTCWASVAEYVIMCIAVSPYKFIADVYAFRLRALLTYLVACVHYVIGNLAC